MQVTTHLDHTLRERADDPDELRDALKSEAADLQSVREALADSPNELDVTRLARVLNRLADHLRLDGRFDAAAEHATQARDIWRDMDRHRAAYLAELRRIHALGDQMEAPDSWRSAREACGALIDRARSQEDLEIYLDFALERRGIIAWRLDALEDAGDDLRAALEIRRERGVDRLVERTETVLEHVTTDA